MMIGLGNPWLGTLLHVISLIAIIFIAHWTTGPWQSNPYAMSMWNPAGAPLGPRPVALCVFRVLLLWLVEIASRKELAATREAGRGRQAEALVTRLLTGICDATARLSDSLCISDRAPKLARLMLRLAGEDLTGVHFPSLLAPDDRARFADFLPQEAQRMNSGEPAQMLHVDLVDRSLSRVPTRIFVGMSLDDASRPCYLVGIINDESEVWADPPGELPVPSVHNQTNASAQASIPLTLKFMCPSFRIDSASEGFYNLVKGGRRLKSVIDILETPEPFCEWVTGRAQYVCLCNEAVEDTSGPVTLSIKVGSYTTRRYEVVFRLHFATSPDPNIPVDATIVSCTRLLPSDPSKGTPPASERGSVQDLTQTSLRNVYSEVIGHAIESL